MDCMLLHMLNKNILKILSIDNILQPKANWADDDDGAGLICRTHQYYCRQ